MKNRTRHKGSRSLALWLLANMALSVAAWSQPGSSSGPEIVGSIDRVDPAIDRLIPRDAVVEMIADGFGFVEGPVWIEDEANGHLLFSDIPRNRVLRWSEANGVTVFLDPVMAPDADTGATGGSNGLVLDAEGRLVLFEHGNRRVARLEEDGSRTVLADRFEGKRLNSPNDGVFHSSGALFFTDPPYGLARQDRDPAKELEWNGVYRLDKSGELHLLAQQKRPNGIGLSPDEKTLYVANSDLVERVWMSYPIESDLTLGEGSVFFDGRKLGAPGVPDGLVVDGEGNVWATGPGGVVVIDPSGRRLGTIELPELPANVTFGGSAGSGRGGHTLFMTARTSLYRLRLGS